jgi:TonB family protein
VIRAAFVLAVTRLVIPRLRSRSAAERHLCWAAALALAAVVPWLGAILPAWQPVWMRTAIDLLPVPFEYLGEWTGTRGQDVVVRATGLDGSGWRSGVAAAAWVAGTLVVMSYLAIQWLRLFRLGSSVAPITDRRIIRLASDAAGASGLTRPPRLMQSARVAIPITWGAFSPRILLPAAAARWSDERIAAILAHEMAHVRRRDWTVHILAEAACAVHWFNPLFWTARNALRRESERAADDVVMNLGVDGRDYAALLLDIVRAARTPPPAATVAMARPSDLAARIASLVADGPNRHPAGRGTLAAVGGLTALLGLPLGAIAAPDVMAYIQVRTASLPRTLLAAVSPPSGAPATAVRHVRLASAPAGASPPGLPERLDGVPPGLPERLDGVPPGLPERLDGVPLLPPEVVEYTTPPLYSDEARQRGIEGVVVVHARVDADGQVGHARIARGLGYGLDQNALVALRQWRFRAGTRGGVPIATDAEIEVEFSLRHEALNELIANDMATQVGPGVIPPRAVVTTRPPATPSGRGRVVLDVVLLEDGRPKIVRVLQSATPELDESAVYTFEQWRFSPALKNGVPIKVRMTAEVSFNG